MEYRKLKQIEAKNKSVTFEITGYLLHNYSRVCERYSLLGDKYTTYILLRGHKNFEPIQNLSVQEILGIVSAFIKNNTDDMLHTVGLLTLRKNTTKEISEKCFINKNIVCYCQYILTNQIAKELEAAAYAKCHQGEFKNAS